MRLDWLELRVPPVAVTAVAAAAIGVAQLASAAPLPAPTDAGPVIGAMLAVAGIAVALAGVVRFRRVRTTVDPRYPERSARLVTDGAYRFSRNPMYLGFVVVLLGLAVALLSPVGLAVAVATGAYLDRFQIRPEERQLLLRFGDDFERYRHAVRRWL